MKALALVAVLAAPVFADVAAKKDRARAGKAPNANKLPAAGTQPAKLVNLYNTWTHEWLAVEVGGPVRASAAAHRVRAVTIDRFLRDHFTNEPNRMEPKLLPILLSAAAHFQADQVMVVSAFRHPKYNLILRKKGHQVARDSQHTHGNAIDFYIPRVTTAQLHTWAKAQALGGVGLYVDSGFIHMDTGKIRFWSGE